LTTRPSSSSQLQVSSLAYLPGTCKEDDDFDQTVGVIQEVLLDSKFERLQKKFCNENCMHFEATEENKLIYMDIFKKYTTTIEAFITQVSFARLTIQRLTEEIPGFEMDLFLEQVASRKDEIDEQIMDLLLSFSDFESFKEMMLFSRAHLVASTPKLKSGKAAALGLKDSMKPAK
jgi:ADP-ribosylation factor 2-binding protein